MAVDRAVLISDVHIDEWEGDLPEQYGQKRQAFLDFLAWVAEGGRQGQVGRLVIGGDIFDAPQRDDVALLPRYEDVLEALRAVLAAGVKLAYVVGNHDSGLLGLSLALADPPVTVDYPCILMKSAGKTVAVEHGHLYDPWLWDYVRHLAEAMWEGDEAPGEPVALGPRAPGVVPRTARDAAATGGTTGPAPLDLQRLLRATRQERLAPAGSLERLAGCVARELAVDYHDVLDATADSATIANLEAVRGRLDGAPPLEQLFRAYYSGPHWRRAAKSRVAELQQQLSAPVAGIVMGHTHWPDAYDWTDDAGAAHQYVNSGTWRHDSADVVIIEGGALRLVHRKWTDPLPELE